MIKINSMQNLLALPNRWINGDQALITDTHELYVYGEDGWSKCGSTEITVSVMDLLKQNLANLPVMEMEAITNLKKDIKESVNNSKNKYFVLMNKDINYWTFFNIVNYYETSSELKTIDSIETVVIELLEEFGEMIAADVSTDNTDVSYFYVRSPEKAILVFVLFPYDGGTIECAK